MEDLPSASLPDGVSATTPMGFIMTEVETKAQPMCYDGIVVITLAVENRSVV